MFTSRVTPLAVLAVWLFTACAPDIDRDPPPDGAEVVPIFDPAAEVIPLPNDAALDDEGRLPDRGGEGAEGAFNAYLSQIAGWSPATLIEVPFSGVIDEDSLAEDTVRLYRFNETGVPERVGANSVWLPNENGDVCDPDLCAGVVRITPDEAPRAGGEYAAIVTRGVTAEDEPVGQSSAMFFALSREPLVTEDDQSSLSVLDNATASALERLRLGIARIVEGAESDGLLRSNIAVAFRWTITANTFTVLDGELGILPLPNTLALDADGTFPRAALEYCGASEGAASCGSDDDCALNQICSGGTCVSTRCAQAELDTYLDQLHGWPTSTPITLPLSGPVDVGTLDSSSVQVWRLDADGPVQIGADLTFDAENSRILVSPDRPMALNQQYVAFATDALKVPVLGPSDDRASVLAPAPIALAVQGSPVADESGRSLVSRLSDQQASQIESLRQGLRPLALAVEAASGVNPDELVALWSWSTFTDAFVVFEPQSNEIPFPNALLGVGCPMERPICALFDPESPPQDPLQASLFDELSQRQGFSTTGTHWLPLSGQSVDAGTVTQENILVAEVNGGLPTLLETSEYSVGLDFSHLLVEPMRPLMPETTVAGLVSNDLRAEDGSAAQPAATFVLLRSEFPLVDENGSSQVGILDDQTATQLEAARQSFSQLFLAATAFGYERDEIVGAWAFTTQQTTRPLQELKAQADAILDRRANLAARRACEPDCTSDPGLVGPLASDATIPDPDDTSVEVDADALDYVQWEAEFESVSFLDTSRRLVDFDSAEEPTIGLSLFVPKTSASCTAPFDMAIYQHGYTDYRKSALAIANELAEECIATVAIDLPLHGGRAAASATLHPLTRPATSGEGFIDSDLVAAKGNLLQGAIDLSVLTRLIRGGGLDGLVDGPAVISDETSQIGYVGISMGGFVGTLFAAVEPELGPTVLNVAGGNYALVLTESDLFAELASMLGPMPGTFAFLQTLHFVQWLGEHADPWVFGRHLVDEPLAPLSYDPMMDSYTEAGQGTSKEVLMQMARDDATVPNASTELLAEAIGASLADTTFDAGHGFLQAIAPDSPDFEAGRCGREQAATWLATGFEGTASLPSNLTASNCVMGN